MPAPKGKGPGVIIEHNRTRIFGAALMATHKKSLKEAGEAGVRRAKAVVPVDTGNLRDSIRYEVKGDELVIYTDVDYGIYVEYGTVHMHARPHMRPGLNEAYRVYEDRMIGIAVGGGPTSVTTSGTFADIYVEQR